MWIMGAEEGNLPHAESTPEEERRLFYVGMTRTKGDLIVSSASDEGPVSRFIAEADLQRTQTQIDECKSGDSPHGSAPSPPVRAQQTRESSPPT